MNPHDVTNYTRATNNDSRMMMNHSAFSAYERPDSWINCQSAASAREHALAQAHLHAEAALRIQVPLPTPPSSYSQQSSFLVEPPHHQQQPQQQPSYHHQNQDPYSASSSTGYSWPDSACNQLHTPQTPLQSHSPYACMSPGYCQGSDEVMTPEQFDEVVRDYIARLSPKKRDKALIDNQRYEYIKRIHAHPKDTSVGTAQFRFWAKKMFRVEKGVVYNDYKPVATREQIFAILTEAHREAMHGGRDKTSGRIRDRWSWIPKELIARYVKCCPSCAARRAQVGRLPQIPGPMQSVMDTDAPYNAPYTAACYPSASESRGALAVPVAFQTQYPQEVSQSAMLAMAQQQQQQQQQQHLNFHPGMSNIKSEYY